MKAILLGAQVLHEDSSIELPPIKHYVLATMRIRDSKDVNNKSIYNDLDAIYSHSIVPTFPNGALSSSSC